MPGHRETHPQFTEGCWACKALSVSISAHATPTRRPEVVDIDRRDSQLDKDRMAYRRLRHAGFQPTKVDGSETLERAEPSCQFEIDTGHLIPRAEMSRVQEGLAVSKELGLITDGGR